MNKHTQSTRHFIALAVVVLILSGCATQQKGVDKITKWQARAAAAQPYLPSRDKFVAAQQLKHKPPKVQTAQMTAAALFKSLPAKKISVRFVGDDLATVLRTMASLAGQNIMVSPHVKGKVIMEIKNSPWNQVFTSIANTYGLSVIRRGDVLDVLSIGDLKEQVKRKSLQMKKEQAQPLVTRIVPIEFSNPDETAKSIEPLLSKDKAGKARGSVTVDAHARALIINDTADNVNKLVKMIYDLDKPTPQILITAQIVETTSDMARELGIRWGALSKVSPGGGAPDVQLNPGAAGATTYDAASGRLIYPTATAIGNNIDLGAKTISGAAPAAIGLLINSHDVLLSAQLSALQRNGKLNVLSTPSIATLDNSEAIIEAGEEVPFQTTSGSTTGGTTVEYKSATLRLTVTPHVIGGKMIRLNIDAKKDEVDTKSNAVNGYPYILKKLAHTQLIIPNGRTVVIGGLDSDTNSDANTGVPGLKDIPLLGHLFKQQSTSHKFTKLLIFITPTILTRKAGA
ncbi:MAG: type IV pilus secretin PilQ [Deltaproteobacteria bacterium]|nr:type IV pilus secretin PilQ [Deltaproteobacteria bacterium]